ncbi:MAG: DotA/TraY family protein [Alphaproteobacteria bacterium]|nr:DotA/TraY family protein [Alphaproteobacteria bacterium]
MNRRIERVLGAFFIAGSIPFAIRAAHAATPAAAQTGGLLSGAPETDWALDWLEALFRGGAFSQGLTGSDASFSALAAALREALSVYSLGMLVLAGFLVAYHVIAMVTETAQHGTAFGRRTNMFWAPLRFVLAIGLLVPIGGGLNTGQFLVVKLAGAGSSLASNAWRGAVDTMKGSLDRFVPPYGPDVVRLTAVAAEMEMCRILYRQFYAALLPDAALNRTGDIGDIQKLPMDRLAPETWRYTNNLNAPVPLCGEYRFLSRSTAAAGAGTDETGQLPAELAAFARADAERLIMQTRPLAEKAATAFLNGASGAAPFANDISSGLTAMMQEQQKAIDGKTKAMTAGNAPVVGQAMDDSASAGWIAAGFFIGSLVRRQAVFGELTAYAVPSAQAPVFGHKALTASMISDAAASDPVLRNAPAAQLDKLYLLYSQMAGAMKQVRAWLYGRQVKNADLILADSLDVGDRLTPVSDSAAGAFLFARVLNGAMAAHGVWADPSRSAGANGSASAFARAMAANPVAGLAELGRRYGGLGNYLLGMAGPGLAEPGVMGSALLFAITGFMFGAAGFLLLFIVPLLPLFRFFLGVMVWLLTVLEAVAALPLVALAHLTPSGEGLSGPLARRAYWLWLGVFMRPLLTLFGFVAGLAVLVFALALLNNLFVPMTHALTVAPDDVFLPVRVGLALAYAVMALAITNLAFKGVSWFPDRILRWLSPAEFPSAAAAAPGASAAGAPSMSLRGPAGAAFLAGAQAVSVSGATPGSRAADRPPTAEEAAARAHGLKAALLPAIHERPEEPVVIGGKEESTASEQSGSAAGSRSGAAAAAAGSSATASATASAQAIAMSRQMPATDKAGAAAIEKALEKLASQKDKRALPPKEEKDLDGKESAKKEESREQSSAPPEEDKPE